MKIQELFVCCKYNRKCSKSIKLLNILIVAILISAFSTLVFTYQVYDFKAVYSYRSVFLKGWLMTCLLSLACLFLSFFLGTLAALMRRSRVLVIRYLSTFYVESIRGTPLLVQLLLFFYVIGSALLLESRFFIGILTLSLFSGAYIAEIVRSGLDSIRSSQIDSAKSIGMTSNQTYRHVIFPLVFRQIIPPLAGQFASIIKDSSLLSIIGISELTYSAQQISSATYSTLETYIPLAFGYLILTLPISLLSKSLERSFRYES